DIEPDRPPADQADAAGALQRRAIRAVLRRARERIRRSEGGPVDDTRPPRKCPLFGTELEPELSPILSGFGAYCDPTLYRDWGQQESRSVTGDAYVQRASEVRVGPFCWCCRRRSLDDASATRCARCR